LEIDCSSDLIVDDVVVAAGDPTMPVYALAFGRKREGRNHRYRLDRVE
jgi:hypothetical protein